VNSGDRRPRRPPATAGRGGEPSVAPRASAPPAAPAAPAGHSALRGSGAPIDRRTTDAIIVALAARQHGAVARAQLLRLGVAASAIDDRVARGWLQRLYRGVYRVGPVENTRTRAMAALLACGEAAVLSHSTAATVVWGCAAIDGAQGLVEVTRPAGARMHVGIRVHRTSLLPSEVVLRDALRVTTPERTILDLAGTTPLAALERLVADAVARRVVRESALLAVLASHPGQRGTSRLRTLLGNGGAPVRSEAEAHFRRLIRGTGLKAPLVNTRVGRYRVDFLWPAERLVVEVDGLAFHGSALRFESDRRRDAELVAAGYRVIRVTWRRLTAEPAAVLVQVAQALAVTTPGRTELARGATAGAE
jgi:very-short-patch-repair endonuclease